MIINDNKIELLLQKKEKRFKLFYIKEIIKLTVLKWKDFYISVLN